MSTKPSTVPGNCGPHKPPAEVTLFFLSILPDSLGCLVGFQKKTLPVKREKIWITEKRSFEFVIIRGKTAIGTEECEYLFLLALGDLNTFVYQVCHIFVVKRKCLNLFPRNLPLFVIHLRQTI